MRKHPGMEHDEPYMAHVHPGKTETIIWQFTKPGAFYYGCLVPGHFEAGMGRHRPGARGCRSEMRPARSHNVLDYRSIINTETRMTRILIAAIVFGALLPLSALAVEAHHQPAVTSSTANAQLSDGEVRKVDRDAKKITIRHGPIANLDMPPMTMVFQIADATMLDQVKTGDKIRFTADKAGGAYTVTRIEPAK